MKISIGQAVSLNAIVLGDGAQKILLENIGECGIVTGKIHGILTNKYRIQSFIYNTEWWLDECVIKKVIEHPHSVQYDYDS